MTLDSTVEAFFFACFAFGALFTLAAALIAGVSAIGHSPVSGDLGDHAPGHAHPGSTGHFADAVADSALERLLAHLNLYSINGFLTWFGAAGFILTRFAAWPLFAAVGVSSLLGCAGALLVVGFLARLRAGERVMRPADYELRGALARTSVAIPAEGVGEIVFSLGGTRRSEAARSADRIPIPRDTEVLVVEYTRGTAIVRPWNDVVASRFPDGVDQEGLVDQRERMEDKS